MWVRLRWTKVGKVRFTSHRDVARIWERALRRADLAVAYSEGFSPRPRVSFGLALPTGSESLSELLDVDLVDGASIDLAALPRRISAGLPVGMSVVEAAVVPIGSDSLQSDVVACDWLVEIDRAEHLPQHGLELVNDAIERFLEHDAVMVTRRRKDQTVIDDIRPSVETLSPVGVSADGNGVLVRAMLGTKPRGVRPGDLVAGLFPEGELVERRSLRLEQMIERAGERVALRAVPHVAVA